MNKKITLFLYYTGLLTGILIINYILKYHVDYAESFVGGFEELKKISSVKGQELFLFLFLKRMKQLCLLCMIYFGISKILSLLILDFYYACVEGMFLSLCVYYYGIINVMIMSLMIIPHFLYFLLIEILGWKYFKKENREHRIAVTNVISCIFIVAISLTIIEISVNFIVIRGILNYV